MHDGILNYTKFGNLLIMAAPAGGRGACPAPGCPPVIVIKNYMCSLHPSHPLLQRKFYVKIHEMCQNIVMSRARTVTSFFIIAARGRSGRTR